MELEFVGKQTKQREREREKKEASLLVPGQLSIVYIIYHTMFLCVLGCLHIEFVHFCYIIYIVPLCHFIFFVYSKLSKFISLNLPKASSNTHEQVACN